MTDILTIFLTLAAALAITAYANGDWPPAQEPAWRPLCLKGRQYIHVTSPEPVLAMVLTWRGGRTMVAACGERTPADLVEAAETLSARLEAIGRLEDEPYDDEEGYDE
jgi:hypothetical protein